MTKLQDLLSTLDERGHYIEVDMLRGIIKSAQGTMTAYHCGHKLTEDVFSTDYLGTGEGAGMHALGPGVYFATEQAIAERYAKYIKYPFFYEVDIQMTNVYDPINGTPERLREPLKQAVIEAAKANGKTVTRWGVRGHSHLKHGAGYPGELNYILGSQGALAKLKEIGCDGQWTKLPAGGYEIAIFNPDVIDIKRVEKRFEGEIPPAKEFPSPEECKELGSKVFSAMSRFGKVDRDELSEDFGSFEGYISTTDDAASEEVIASIINGLIGDKNIAKDLEVHKYEDFISYSFDLERK
jgi:hypothetical protein